MITPKMKQLLIMLLLCLGMTYPSPAQQYFNVRNPLNSFFSIVTSIMPHHNKYYCIGYSWDSVNYVGNGMALGITGVFFAVFDQYGNKLWSTNYQKNGKNIAAWNSKLWLQPDETFLLAADETDTAGNWYVTLIKFDTTGKVLFEKEFPKSICTGIPNDFWRLVDLKQDQVGNWIILTTIKCENSGSIAQHDFYIIKLNKDLDLIWSKQLGSPTLNDIAGKLTIEPDGYIIAGGRKNDNITLKNFSFNAEMIKIDTNGVILWTWFNINYGKLTNYIRDVIRTKDGGYLYCGQGDGYEIMGANGQYSIPAFRGWVEKLDSNRKIVWNRSFNNYYGNTEFKKIIEAPDGRLFLFGNKYMPDSLGPDNWLVHTRGRFMTLSANGDSLNERIYYGVNTCSDKNLLYDAQQTDDGGFILCGEATDRCSGFTPPSQRGWLVKVDSNGCLGPGDPQCWPTAVPATPKTPSFFTYPNPVNDEWNIANPQNYTLRLSITDLTGRTLLETQSAATTIRLSLANLASGIYLYQIKTNNGTTTQGKIWKK